ncbi:hypothetical protein MSG28_002323 [Choristoneura fumiferana]|uniref:Uncharacterized protein n=1 Tax=Choristoneura fumiferana TaxID=7141 RepID=A0ACC0JV30_CHOFU|nr:hypothetical protein MSG28_002323 [Choristoneura fumiferana]
MLIEYVAWLYGHQFLRFPRDRLHDYENFLATLLMTKAIRSPTLVVRAFNVEIARVQDQTTDPQTALFRLQFWQDTLSAIFKKDQTLRNVPANPVAQELFKIYMARGITAVGRPPTICSSCLAIWTDNIVRVAGNQWMQVGSCHSLWHSKLRPLCSSGCLSADDDDEQFKLP